MFVSCSEFNIKLLWLTCANVADATDISSVRSGGETDHMWVSLFFTYSIYLVL